MKAKPNPTIRRLVMSALFAAAITIMTAYILHIPIGVGYIHLGDMMIYLAACLLPPPYAIAAGMIGGALADLLTAPLWVVPTLIMKCLIVLPFTSRGARLLTRRNKVAVLLSGIISPVGYGLAACVLFDGAAAFLPSFLTTLVQSVPNGILFVLLAAALDRAKMKERLTVL